MSSRRLIFSFKNGIKLALDEEKVAQGAIIDFDLDFDQVKMDYEGHLLKVVNSEEAADLKTILSFKSKENTTVMKKRKFEGTEEKIRGTDSPTVNVAQMQSMVLTTEGSLITAPLQEAPAGTSRRIPLSRTQRRNMKRRKLLMQDRLEKEIAREAASAGGPVTRGKEQVQDQPVGYVIPQPPIEQVKIKPVAQPALPEHAPIEPHEDRITVPVRRSHENQQEIVPYIPRLDRPKRLQIISEEELEKFQRVRKENFEHYERIRGKKVNILEGLELHTNVFSKSEQRSIVDYVFHLKDLGREGRLREKTYSEPRRWMRGKGRVTIQYGCCYNYAHDSEGNPPGIIRHDKVDLMPSILKSMIKRMVSWRILPADCVPNSCIINIYNEGDCIPPHVDHHDFLRPFCTVSFLSRCNIMFGKELRVVGPGEFSGPVKIPLPVGSVLVLKGNGADLAKHCVPGVPRRRVSITFRKMDDDKVPLGYRPDPDLEGLQPLEL